MQSQLHVPRKLQRSTLIAGIFAVGSLLLCCLSGTIGWFNSYWAIASAMAACSTDIIFLPSHKNQDTSEVKNRLSTKVTIVFSIAALAAAHVFILKQNISPSENLLGNHDQGIYLATASHLKKNGSHAMATDWLRQSPVEYKRFLTREISPSLKTESPDDSTHTGTQARSPRFAHPLAFGTAPSLPVVSHPAPRRHSYRSLHLRFPVRWRSDLH